MGDLCEGPYGGDIRQMEAEVDPACEPDLVDVKSELHILHETGATSAYLEHLVRRHRPSPCLRSGLSSTAAITGVPTSTNPTHRGRLIGYRNVGLLAPIALVGLASAVYFDLTAEGSTKPVLIALRGVGALDPVGYAGSTPTLAETLEQASPTHGLESLRGIPDGKCRPFRKIQDSGEGRQTVALAGLSARAPQFRKWRVYQQDGTEVMTSHTGKERSRQSPYLASSSRKQLLRPVISKP